MLLSPTPKPVFRLHQKSSPVGPLSLWMVGFMVFVPLLIPVQALAQGQVQVIREIQLQGTFQLLVGDEMTIVDVDGKEYRFRIQADPDKPIGLSGGDVALALPAGIDVKATVTPAVLAPGMVVLVDCKLGAAGKTGAVSAIRLLPIGSTPQEVVVDVTPQGRDLVDARVEGVIKSISGDRMVLTVPRHDLVPRGTLTFDPSAITEIEYNTDSLRMLRQGDVVSQVDAADVSTGDSVVRRIQIELIGIRDDLRLSIEEKLQLKHHELSDAPGDPREFRSQHYLLMTDISDRQANVLLDKLEGVFELVGNYYGRFPRTLIEVYVVDDLNRWDTSGWDPRVLGKLRRGEGTTVYARQGRNKKTAVFSANKQDVVQHEAVHGFCYLTFQGTGKLWYAEGIAEMGQYWKPDDVSVAASPAVIGYLRSRQPHPLKSIINATKIEGEVWKAYAWRWALCHFLATNPNYADQFRQLGVGLMRESPSASFENTWRRQANELTFEYEHFLANLEAGLRADLCAWQWDVESQVPNTGRALQQKILAARGWQATGAEVEVGVTYETRAKGQWRLSAGGELIDADGDVEGQGQLIGVIMKDFQLSEEFELGKDPDFTASSDGQLYVRCRERMSLIADNEGEVNFAIRRKK